MVEETLPNPPGWGRFTAVALTPGWLRSEVMLDAYKVTEANWRDATAVSPHFAISESPAFAGRAVAALAGDPDVSRWSGQTLSSGQLAKVYGFTDLDGSSPMPGATWSKSRTPASPPTSPDTADSARSRLITLRCLGFDGLWPGKPV